jgi:hypothetical protein
MSNKTQLQNNNTALDGYIARINAAKEVAAGLPEAGGGGSGSVETITVSYGSLPDPGMMIHYIDNTMTLQQASVSRTAQYTILKGTIFIVESCMIDTFGGCSKIAGNNTCKAFLATK